MKPSTLVHFFEKTNLKKIQWPVSESRTKKKIPVVVCLTSHVHHVVNFIFCTCLSN